MAKVWTPPSHPECVWALSCPPYDRGAKSQVTSRLYLTAREACWGVVDGEGNGSKYSFQEGQEFGKLSLLAPLGAIDLSHLARTTFTDLVIECERAGIEREYGYEDGVQYPQWRMYAPEPDKAKLYTKLRKASHTALLDNVGAVLAGLGLHSE